MTSLRLFVVLLVILFLPVPAAMSSAEIRAFSSDGCSLFPDGTLSDRNLWCDCCFSHDLAYWQGGSEALRLAADEGLRDCVLKRSGDATLAKAMYFGVRAGGHPAVPAWYRWGYGWDYGRGYQSLTDDEKAQVKRQLKAYAQLHPGGYCSDAADNGPARPASWAVPLAAKQLKNFYRLDDKVYRAAQPNTEGFAELKELGIDNLLNLREYHDDDAGVGLKLYRVKMAAGSITTEQVVAALRIIHLSEGPILIHCWHGSDRTGMVSAMYRIIFQGWDKQAAIAELTDGGYGYHAFWYRNIPEFIRTADLEAIRKAVLSPDQSQ